MNDPLAPLRTRGWLDEAQRKAIHLAAILVPLAFLHDWLPWPRTRWQWEVLLFATLVAAMALDVVRIRDRRFRRAFGRFFGGMVRSHERFDLLGSTYMVLGALLAIAIFPRPVAAAAIGFAVLGDGVAALVGKAWGRRRYFGKTLEGSLGGLTACLVWGAYLALGGHASWPAVLVGAAVASLVELLPIPLNDNLGVALFSGYAMELVRRIVP